MRHFSRASFISTLSLLLGLFSLWLPTSASAKGVEMHLSGPLEPGSAALLRVKNFPANSVIQATLGGILFPITDEGVGLVAVDMEAKPGPLTLRVTVDPPQGRRTTLEQTIQLPSRQYKEERIDGLPGKKVDLNKPDLTRAGKETAAIRATYKRRGGMPGYGDGFVKPVEGRLSGVFGSRRILNGKPRKPHSGIDIAAPKGTPVRSTASGKVALVGNDYFFTGNTVIVDHGDGVISLYSHMDSIAVSEGMWVAKGSTIGTVGMTGRATGPHLHFAVLVRKARVDPLLLPGIRE
ncbi:MAG: M23 family metallopeptidase [Magnetococcales bacterium]|nr:M23 family metallopeptidase [Magnetococcales bacterium]